MAAPILSKQSHEKKKRWFGDWRDTEIGWDAGGWYLDIVTVLSALSNAKHSVHYFIDFEKNYCYAIKNKGH